MFFSNTFRKTRNPVFTFTGEWRRMHEIRIRSNWNAFWFTNFGWLSSFFSLFTRAAHIHFATEFICLRLTFHRLDASNRVQPSTQTLSMYSNSNNFMYTPLHTSIRTHRSSLSLVCYILLACWLFPSNVNKNPLQHEENVLCNAVELHEIGKFVCRYKNSALVFRIIR